MSPLDVAVEAVKETGDLLLDLSAKEIVYHLKGSHDVLAEADLKAEELILNKIRKNFPDHGILSEEAGATNQDAEFLWVVDPIDGTVNFTRNIEEYCVSIGLCQNGKIILGVIYQPSTQKLYVAQEGTGAFLNGRPLRVAVQSYLINSLAATDNSSKLESRKSTYETLLRINDKVRHIRIMGSGALHLARVAEGKLDLYFKTGFNFWDYAAGIILIREAGGKVTDFSGAEITIDSKNILATNALLHEEALKLLTA